MDQPQILILKNRNYVVWPHQLAPLLPTENPKPSPISVGSSRRPVSAAAAEAGWSGGWKVRPKPRRFHQKQRRFGSHNTHQRFAPFAPRNTTSFIIRAKRCGGIASQASPCPVTPAILPSPILSPSREFLVDMAKEQWGVDCYGTMKGRIRLRSPPRCDDEEEVERRLDHDLSRFEMVYPSFGKTHSSSGSSVLESRVDDQDNHIARLEEENITLKERVFLMERELEDLQRRVQCLETDKVFQEASETDGGGADGESDSVNHDDTVK